MSLAALVPTEEPRRCLETGLSLEGRLASTQFASNAAKDAWNNRRKRRGAELYDLFMVYRYQRGLAKKLKVFSTMCSLARHWRAEDKAAGRVSFVPMENPTA